MDGRTHANGSMKKTYEMASTQSLRHGEHFLDSYLPLNNSTKISKKSYTMTPQARRTGKNYTSKKSKQDVSTRYTKIPKN